jgi:hypothetical protein
MLAEKVKGQNDLIRYKFYGGKAKNKRHLIACCSSLSILIICMYNDGMWHAKRSRRAQPEAKKFVRRTTDVLFNWDTAELRINYVHLNIV